MLARFFMSPRQIVLISIMLTSQSAGAFFAPKGVMRDEQTRSKAVWNPFSCDGHPATENFQTKIGGAG